MPDTPKHYTQILDLITAQEEPSEKELGRLELRQFQQLRETFSDRNMVGIGVCYKVAERTRTDQLSVCFYIEKRVPESNLSRRNFIPRSIVAPGGEEVPTDVKVIGKVWPQVNDHALPVQSGFSVAHKDMDTDTGTLGAIVRKGADLYILSNSHVLAKSGTARRGDMILYPGKSDGGVLGTNDIATLSDFKPFILRPGFKNLYDAALAKILPGRAGDLDFTIRGITGTPQTMKPAIGMKVIIKGRTSDEDEGLITDVDLRARLSYAGFASEIEFTNQVHCERYSLGGDSGAIVVAKDFGKIVGLHFAGNNDCSWFTDIATVKSNLGFEFVGTGGA